MTTMHDHHPLVRLARAAIEAFVCEDRMLTPEEAPSQIQGDPAGVFVTIHTQTTRDLRGCIGTIQSTAPTLAEETIHNAISAATRDWRFAPISPDELDDLEIEVSVLHPAEHIGSVADLDPRRYGVIVEHGRRRGLLLPDIPGIDDVRTQVDLARQKAGIGRDQPIEMWRFQVDKYE